MGAAAGDAPGRADAGGPRRGPRPARAGDARGGRGAPCRRHAAGSRSDARRRNPRAGGSSRRGDARPYRRHSRPHRRGGPAGVVELRGACARRAPRRVRLRQGIPGRRRVEPAPGLPRARQVRHVVAPATAARRRTGARGRGHSQRGNLRDEALPVRDARHVHAPSPTHGGEPRHDGSDPAGKCFRPGLLAGRTCRKVSRVEEHPARRADDAHYRLRGARGDNAASRRVPDADGAVAVSLDAAPRRAEPQARWVVAGGRARVAVRNLGEGARAARADRRQVLRVPGGRASSRRVPPLARAAVV